MNRVAWALCVVVLAAASLACSLLDGKAGELRFSPDALPAALVGQPYRAVITLSNQRTPAFQMGVKEDSLPPGLAGVFDQDEQTFTISGVPTQPGVYSLTVSGLCYGTNVSGQTGEKTYQLVIH